MSNTEPVSRRVFLKHFGIVGTTCFSGSAFFSGCFNEPPSSLPLNIPEHSDLVVLDDFKRSNSKYLGDEWESLNPGYWSIQNNALQRILLDSSDPLEVEWYPWHWETHLQQEMPINNDPSLPFGMIWRRDWQLSGNYFIQADFEIIALPPDDQNSPHKQLNASYSCFGICFGSSCLHESGNGSQSSNNSSLLRSLGKGNMGSEAAWMLLLTDDGRFGIYSHTSDELIPVEKNCEIKGIDVKPGSTGSFGLYVWGSDNQYANITGILSINDSVYTIELPSANRISFTNGYLGLVTRGLIDFRYTRIALDAGENFPLETPINELHTCYALGDSIRREAGEWHCTFIAIVRSQGEKISIRISDQEFASADWENVDSNGEGSIVSNEFRLYTAVIDVRLPFSPAKSTMYYTVWKDGQNITSDPRINSQSVGAGTGFIGQVPLQGDYVGRLPKLEAPYKLCGISSRSINDNPTPSKATARYEPWFISDQPVEQSFQHLEEYNFQILLWEDGIWQLASISPPSTTSDAYKIICTTIAGPTSRWQMMRHWNIMNPGGAEYGMEDTKGPEKFIVRHKTELGQDPQYMRRNFQIVQHLCFGEENPLPDEKPKNWRKWRLPNKDLSIYIMDSRTWRTSQDTNIWDDQGWGHQSNLYDRTAPTRTLLGEEQFSWLSNKIKTDASPQICITGINGLHTIWAGVMPPDSKNTYFSERDRRVANYAGWVKEGSNRVLELLSSREGIITLYGGTGNACILLNDTHQICECCFGPTGLNKRQGLIAQNPLSHDADGRPIQLLAFYGRDQESANLIPRNNSPNWNFMEIELQSTNAIPSISLSIRDIIDSPNDYPRGGNSVTIRSNDTGRPADCALPNIQLIPEADVLISSLEGEPIRGTQTGLDGTINYTKLVGIKPDTSVLITAYNNNNSISQIVNTIAASSNTDT